MLKHFHISDLSPLVAGIEATVAAAIDPISLASEALADCASYLEVSVREDIEQALAGITSSLYTSAACDTPRTPCSIASHSKQLMLSSSRISGACSTFRAVSPSRLASFEPMS